MLERLPAWATTGVGSLPHRDAAAAAAHAVGAYEVPYCPQLPWVEGDMVTEWLGADAERCGWSPARDRERPPAWEALLAQLDRRRPPHGVVKLQVTGPATLACALERERGGRVTRREALALAGELSSWLAADAADQVRQLAARGLDALLVLDEPALHVFGTAGIETVWEPLRAIAPAWGLHLCCAVPWDAVERAQPDVLSFDLALAPVDARAAQALRRLLARGGRVAWGVVAVHRAEHAAHATPRLRAALARVGGPPELLARQSLLTPSCGSGRMSLEREAEVARALLDTARALRGEELALGSR